MFTTMTQQTTRYIHRTTLTSSPHPNMTTTHPDINITPAHIHS